MGAPVAFNEEQWKTLRQVAVARANARVVTKKELSPKPPDSPVVFDEKQWEMIRKAVAVRILERSAPMPRPKLTRQQHREVTAWAINATVV